PSIRTDLRNAGVNVVDQEAARDGNLATSRSPDDLCLLFRRGGTVQPTGAGNRS
ncbi:DJ-1/PfpI family protein, partial [Micrococcus luteus]|nr:DJ-1/PfpI family protein [Micrococcus luteus]